MVEHGPTWRIKGRAMARPGPMGATPLQPHKQTVFKVNIPRKSVLYDLYIFFVYLYRAAFSSKIDKNVTVVESRPIMSANIVSQLQCMTPAGHN